MHAQTTDLLPMTASSTTGLDCSNLCDSWLCFGTMQWRASHVKECYAVQHLLHSGSFTVRQSEHVWLNSGIKLPTAVDKL